MSLLIWASDHWHLFDKNGTVIDSGTNYKLDDPALKYPDAQVYLAVSETQIGTLAAV